MDDSVRNIIRKAKLGDADAWAQIQGALAHRLVEPRYFYQITFWQETPIGDFEPDYHYTLTKEKVLDLIFQRASVQLIENGDEDLINPENPKETIRAWIQIFDLPPRIQRIILE